MPLISAKEKFALLANEENDRPDAHQIPGLFCRNSRTATSLVSDAAGLADEGYDVALLDVLAGADMANRAEVAQADWLPGAAPGVITGYLFSSPAWRDQEQSLVIAPSGAAARIREVAST